MVRYRIIFTGLVQGVGFRYFVSRTARMQGLTGFVQNLDDGRVEAEVQGSEDQFASFLAMVREGNGYARVGDFSIQHIDLCLDERSFNIV